MKTDHSCTGQARGVQRQQFTFYESYLDGLDELAPKDQGAVMLAIARYALRGIEPKLTTAAERMAFKLIRPTLDSSRRKASSCMGVPKARSARNSDSSQTPQPDGGDSAKNPQSNLEVTAKNPQSNLEDSPLIEREGEKEKEREGEVEVEKEVEKEDERRASTVSDETVCRAGARRVVDAWNALAAYGVQPVSRLIGDTKRAQCLNARIREHGVDAVLEAIERVRTSEFLRGKNPRGWVITFDWFVLPNNFPKVLEGNYGARGTPDRPAGSNPFLNLLEENYGQS